MIRSIALRLVVSWGPDCVEGANDIAWRLAGGPT